MKKIISILLVLSLSIVLSACGSEAGVMQEGPFEVDSFSITVPQGWFVNTADNQVVFTTEDYPETASYIAVSTDDELQVEELLANKDLVISQVLEELNSQLGEDCGAEISVYKAQFVNDVMCVQTFLSYVSEGTKITQEQYSFDTSYGSATFTFATVGDEDFSEEFKASLDSIVIR